MGHHLSELIFLCLTI